MKYLLSLLICLGLHTVAGAQTYADSIAQWRKHYTDELIADKRAPIKHAQAKYLQFFVPDQTYKVWATVTESVGSTPFMVPTHSGKQKPFKEYAVLTFELKGQTMQLHAYQSVNLVSDAAHKDDLFVPFNDETNYDLTYGGGRYIDLNIKDIQNGSILRDFNKCYNPYCAYADGFSCPIPPSENRLKTEIRAGEKMFVR